MRRRSVRWLAALACGCLPMAVGAGRALAQKAAANLGMFTDHGDVGTVQQPGTVIYDAARQAYTISGSGANVWAAADAFQFVWKRVEGDFTLTADVSVLGQGGDPHKKAMLMARQSLDADSAYADVALHGVGLTSLQSRDARGEQTHEVQSNISSPKRLRLVKYGDEFTMWLAGEDGEFRYSGAAMRVPLTGQFYVGLGVCAHNKDAAELAEFRNVTLQKAYSLSTIGGPSSTTLETITVASTDRRVTYVGSLGGPNWTPDGASLEFTHDGRIEAVPVAGGEPKAIDTGFAAGMNLFHAISPDGKMLAFGHFSNRRDPEIYVMPIAGGAPRRVTTKSPSHSPGWSPDGKSLVFSGRREGRFGIYTIPVAGGEEKLLIALPSAGSAEYSPDGRFIYFDSSASGAREIWRMKPDGSEPEQVTKDGAGNWYPHMSPDGGQLAFLTPQQRDSGFPHALNGAPVMLRAMTLADGQIRTLAKFVGGLTSMPNASWSPDSKRIAFVSYQGMR